jgi:hypothetical protein
MVYQVQQVKDSLEETDQQSATVLVAEAEAPERSGRTEPHRIRAKAEMGRQIT